MFTIYPYTYPFMQFHRKKSHFLCDIFRKTSNHRKTFEQGFMVQRTKSSQQKMNYLCLGSFGSAEIHIINPGSITETANKKLLFERNYIKQSS